MEMPNNNIPVNPFTSNGTDTTVASGGLGALKTVANNLNNGTNSGANNRTNNGNSSVVQNQIGRASCRERV